MKRKKVFMGSFVNPLIPKFKLADLVQIIIGASILAVPVGFTEETWNLGGTLPILNTLALIALSFLFISTFTYYHYHKSILIRKKHWGEFFKRVVFTYLFSLLVVAIILTLIQRAPWETNFLIAFKRVIIVTFPSSMSAAIADTIK